MEQVRTLTPAEQQAAMKLLVDFVAYFDFFDSDDRKKYDYSRAIIDPIQPPVRETKHLLEQVGVPLRG